MDLLAIFEGWSICESLDADMDIAHFAQTCRSSYNLVIDLLYKNSKKVSEGWVLIWAGSEGKEKAAEMAIRYFSTDDIHLEQSVYGQALCGASKAGHFELTTMILQNTEVLLDELYSCNFDYWIDAALQNDAEHGYENIVQLLFGKGADVNMYEDGPTLRTPLICAAAAGHRDVVGYLLENGANIDQAGKDNWTALHEAASGGFVDIVTVLLEHGADVELEDWTVSQPCHLPKLPGSRMWLKFC